MDNDVARWVLDFLLRQSLDDHTLNKLVRIFPLSNDDSNLKKLLLLNKIESLLSKGTISVKLLGLLEQIEELNYRNKYETTAAMKSAYCAVAVHCTVRVSEKGEFFDAVKRIWRVRVCQMENLGLVSDELMSWRDEIETAIWDERVCENLLVKGEGIDVMEKVRVYVEEAKRSVGPSFLELVAETLSDNALAQVLAMESEDVHKGDKLPRRKRHASRKYIRSNSRTSRGVKIVDTEDVDVETSHSKYGCLSTPEVTKLKEALQSSTSELQAMVTDPLPDAKQMANDVLSNMAAADKNPDAVRAGKDNPGNNGCSHQTNDPKPSLMERNSTARTYEWDESTDGSPDRSNRPHLPSPKKRVVSPLKKYEAPKPLRRKRKAWTNLEEDTLREGVRKYGVGNWKVILNANKDIFDERTEVDLKDKWRNLTRF